jgi:hypothetical protein
MTGTNLTLRKQLRYNEVLLPWLSGEAPGSGFNQFA